MGTWLPETCKINIHEKRIVCQVGYLKKIIMCHTADVYQEGTTSTYMGHADTSNFVQICTVSCQKCTSKALPVIIAWPFVHE
jgi:hypothetical protein